MPPSAFHFGRCGKLTFSYPLRGVRHGVRVLLQITTDEGAAGDAMEVAIFEKDTERPEEPADEYKVPMLPPELAANLALAIEMTAPVVLVLGLFTRPAALILLGMTTAIEIFVYPQAWPTHIQWAAMLREGSR